MAQVTMGKTGEQIAQAGIAFDAVHFAGADQAKRADLPPPSS